MAELAGELRGEPGIRLLAVAGSARYSASEWASARTPIRVVPRKHLRLSSLPGGRRFYLPAKGGTIQMNRSPEQNQQAIVSAEDPTATPPEPAVMAGLPGEMAVELICPKCTGPMLKCQVGHVGIYGWWLERELRQAGTLGPPRTVSSEVAARVCVRCGFTELYATEPSALLAGDDLN